FTSLLFWGEPLVKSPLFIIRNVLSYGSLWGTWGITFWLRLTKLAEFSTGGSFNLLPMERLAVTTLKLVVIAAVLVMTWRRRHLGPRESLDSMAFAWIIFFLFAPGMGVQYMVWPAPFLLLLSPVFFAWFVA